MEIRPLFNRFLKLIRKKLNEITPKLPEKADDDEMEEEALHLKLLLRQKQLYVGIKLDLESYCDKLPIFGFKSLRIDLNLIREYLLENLLKDFHCFPTVIKTCKKVIAMNSMGLQSLDNSNFLGGATSLDKLLKAYGTWEQKGFFPYEWFDNVEKLRHTELHKTDSFYSKLKNCNVLETDFIMYNCLPGKGITSSVALKKLGLSSPSPGKEENCQDLKAVWEENDMESLRFPQMVQQ